MERVIAKRTQLEQFSLSTKARVAGGKPIDRDSAISLRQVVFGSAAAPPRGEWTRTGIVFEKTNQELSFGLRCPRNATRGLQSVLQAFIIKHFLFDRRPKEKTVPLEFLLKPREDDQNEALWSAMAEILWTIGEKQRVVAVLCGDISHVGHNLTYFQDSVTERLYTFEFTTLDDVQIFLKRNLVVFQENPGPGALLFLYSCVLTRTTSKILTDLDAQKGSYLMGHYEEGSLNVVTLLLTGRATPYLHNGIIYVGDEDHYAMPQFGILARATIGFMILDGDNDAMKHQGREPGSRLKTPALPVWVTCCNNHFGVIFNSNRELLRNYHAEKRFDFHYYTCAGCFLSMTVDNRVQDSTAAGDTSQGATAREDISRSPIEKMIYTKWPEAKITFHAPPPAQLLY